MDMPKLLIADFNDEYRQILFEKLSQHYHIKTCRDGLQALELMRSFRPELLILDLMLPQLDGISLLHRAQKEGIQPVALVFCPYPSDYVTNSLCNLGVSYYMSKPCDLQAVTDRLADLASQLQPEPVPQANLTTAVSGLLLSLNMQARWDGFRFLNHGVPLFMNDPGQSMTKELYVTIGKAFGKDARQVERSIRSAIDKSWQNRDDRVWRQYFAIHGGTIPRPSNNEFFARMANALTEQGYGAKRA